MRVTASNASSFTVGRTFPADLEGLAFAGAWAESGRASSGYDTISGSSDTQDDETQHHYRFGGRVSGISSSTTPGAYQATISLTVTCM